MSPKLQAVCEKLTRLGPDDILRELLRFEKAGTEADWLYCCEDNPGEDGNHGEDCCLDKILKDIGLPDQKAREAMRDELGLED